MPSSGVRIAVWPTPKSRSGCARAVARHPPVVGLHAGVLVVEVGVVAQHHADGRVDHLAADAVAVLVAEAGLGVPAAAVQLVEHDAEHGDLLGRLAGGRHQAHGHRSWTCPG